jgi:hypothetical protein
MKDVERVFKRRILAFIGCFGYLVEIFRIGCSLVSSMRFCLQNAKWSHGSRFR